jgi:hypothetical protein
MPAGTANIIVEQPFGSGHANFDNRSILAFILRRMSPETSARVKWRRKKAREGLLPPVLLWWFSGLVSYIVLDGHDRLLAAALEHQPIDTIRLVRRHNVSPEPGRVERLDQEAVNLLNWDYRASDKQKSIRVEIVNRMLVEAHTPQIRDTNSNNMVGSMSVEEWKKEVSEELTKTYGSSINADFLCRDISKKMAGTADDNDF